MALCLFELAAEPLRTFNPANFYGLLAASWSTLFIAEPGDEALVLPTLGAASDFARTSGMLW